MSVELKGLDTEGININSENIDSVSILDKVRIINEEDKTVAYAVEKQLPHIAKFIEETSKKLKDGGRLFYIGAGTSGRLGILDASECPPTYGVSYELVQGLIAGGKEAIIKAKEGSEDNPELGKQDLIDKQFTKKDVVLGIAASGRTPYVIGALEYANQIGAFTGALSCCHDARISKVAKCAIEVICGPEVISGSTRMKAGTAQKMVLNMISTTCMIELGKVYKNYMVDVQPTNEKLVARSKRLIGFICECSKEESEKLYEESKGNLKCAIVMHQCKVTLEEAKKLLSYNENNISKVLNR